MDQICLAIWGEFDITYMFALQNLMCTYLLHTSVVHVDVDDNILCDQPPVGEGVDRVVWKTDASQEVLMRTTRQEVLPSRDDHWGGRSLGCQQEKEGEHAFFPQVLLIFLGCLIWGDLCS